MGKFSVDTSSLEALLKKGFLPQGAENIPDPSMMQPAGMPPGMPMDPSMMGAPPGMPPGMPMDPSMMGMAPPPMDPSMMGMAPPPMDPSMGMPPEVAPEAPPEAVTVSLEDLKALLAESNEPKADKEKPEGDVSSQLAEVSQKLDDLLNLLAMSLQGMAVGSVGSPVEGPPNALAGQAGEFPTMGPQGPQDLPSMEDLYSQLGGLQ